MRKKFSLSILAALAAVLCVAGAALAVTYPIITSYDQSGYPSPGQVTCNNNGFPGGTLVANFPLALLTPGSTQNGVTIDATADTDGDGIPNTFDFTSTTSFQYVLIHTGGQFTLYDYGTNVTGTFTGLMGVNGKNLSGVTFCTGSGTAAVTLRSVTAKRSAKGVTVNWRTASEVDVAGYNVYGLVHGKRVKLNAHVIASKGAGANSYAFSYRTPKGQQTPSRLWLQAINLDGSRQWRAARIVH